MFSENLHLYKTVLDLEDFSHAYLTSVASHITRIGVQCFRVTVFIAIKDVATALFFFSP